MFLGVIMKYEDWERVIPEEIKGDSLWKMEAYRLALFAVDLGWYDVTKLMQDRRTMALSGFTLQCEASPWDVSVFTQYLTCIQLICQSKMLF